MSDLTVKTNRQYRWLTMGADVPAAIMADQFSHLDEDENIDGFFCYRGYWYHLSDFMHLDGAVGGELDGWHGYHGDSAFSGVVIKLDRDGEQVVCGTYFF